MAKKPQAPEQDSITAAPGADISPESQQPEQADTPPFEADAPPPEMSAEEAAVLEAEGQAVLFEMGEELPDPNGAADIAPEISEEAQPTEPISFEAFKAAQEAAPVVDAPNAEQTEDTRQEWEKPLAEVEAEQQPKRRGRPSKTDRVEQGEDTSGQSGPVDKVVYFVRSKAKEGTKKTPSWRHAAFRISLLRFRAVAERRQCSSAAPKPRRKMRVKLWPHFWAAKVPSHQTCRFFRASW